MIQGFEFVHELAWNVLKDFLEFEGIQGIVGSRGAVREAFKRDLIEDGELWMDMTAKRHLSSHTYHQALAQALVHTIIHHYHPVFFAFKKEMQSRM